MESVLLFATVISPIILALVELVKSAVNIPKKFIPLTALVLGIWVGLIAQPFTELDLFLRLWAGGLAGLSATGLFQLIPTKKGK